METPIKQAAVKRILHNTRTYNSQNGTMYVHQIEFDNGDRGDYSSKSELCQDKKFKEGEVAYYTVEENGKYTPKIKPAEPPQGTPGANRKAGNGSMESFSLSYAKDLACARLNNKCGEGGAESVIADAEKFYNWLISKQS